MSDDLLRRMEKRVRRFGGPMAIDDLLPELDAESGVFLSSAGEGAAADGGSKDFRRESDGSPVAESSEEIREFGSRSIDPNID